jgi:hypothetical protein
MGCIMLCACDQGSPSIDSRLVSTYVDIRVMEQSLGTETPEARLARKSIVEKHGYTLESYKKAIDNILEDDSRWVPFQQAVVRNIDSLLGNPLEPLGKKGAKK